MLSLFSSPFFLFGQSVLTWNSILQFCLFLMLSAYKTAEIKREEDRSLIKVEKLEREREQRGIFNITENTTQKSIYRRTKLLLAVLCKETNIP